MALNISHFRRLSKAEVYELLSDNSYFQIAKKYNVSKEMIKLHVSKLFKIKEVKLKEIEEFDGVPIFLTEGAWLDSPERKAYLLIKKLKQNERAGES